MFGDQINNLSFLFIREWLNGGLFPLTTMLAIILLVFMFEHAAVYGAGWTKRPGVATACILFWLIAADSMRAGLAWATLRAVNDPGPNPPWMANVNALGFIVTAIILIAVVIRATYMFTPARWGHWYWIISVLITVAFLTASHILPPFQ